MNEEIKELIAIGASVTARCNKCLEYHIQKAKELDCSQDEIKEAVEVGKNVKRGSWSMMNEEIENILNSGEKNE